MVICLVWLWATTPGGTEILARSVYKLWDRPVALLTHARSSTSSLLMSPRHRIKLVEGKMLAMNSFSAASSALFWRP
ncbi:hypothetical protein F5B18DRAFT_636614 [Nemania serpens]|nr:hypothetical protein F5B18DRAFT_636614 [Nemania serpens]